MEELSFYIYATTTKIALIFVGGLAIWLGYRLFTLGIGREALSDIAATAEGSKLNLSIANAAPGTCFALFGAIIVGSVAWTAPPTYDKASRPDGTRSLTLRGSETRVLQPHIKALSNVDLTLEQAAPEFAAIAEIMAKSGRTMEAKVYSQIAMTIDPSVLLAAEVQVIALARLGECNSAFDLLENFKELGLVAGEKTVQEINHECL